MLLSLLRAVSPCKDFFQFTIHLVIYLFCRIVWPLIGDQPVAAAHVSENLHAAIELFQVRSREGINPVYRNGLTPAGTRDAVGIEVRETIDLCRSEIGRELRRNAEKLKARFAKAWEEDGAAVKEIRKFLDTYS